MDRNRTSSNNSRGGKHTIVLVQQTQDLNTRTFTDHSSVTEAMQSLLELFELDLQNTRSRDATYDQRDLYRFVDRLHDVSVLVFDQTIKAYVPHDKEFVKQKMYATLTRNAGPAANYGGRR